MTTEIISIPVDKVIVDTEIYPRDKEDMDTIQTYRMSIDELPAIIVALINGIYILGDGFHRLAAHRQEGRDLIQARVYKNITRKELKEIAIYENSRQGKNYTVAEKERLSRELYEDGYETERICEIVAVGKRRLRDYLKKLKKMDVHEQRKEVERRLEQGQSQTQIAKETGVSQPTVSRWAETIQSGNVAEMNNEVLPDHLRVYNVWRFMQPSTAYETGHGTTHRFGTVDPQVVEHILYYFTELGDLCVDPMAGQGLFSRICKKMNRVGLMYDIAPVSVEVKMNDITKGLPQEAIGCKHMMLDPPYYNNKVKDAYSSIEEFLGFMRKVAKVSWDTLADEGTLSLIMQDGFRPEFNELIGECYKIFVELGFSAIARISSPIPENVSGLHYHVAAAKKEKRLMYNDRVIYIFKKNWRKKAK